MNMNFSRRYTHRANRGGRTQQRGFSLIELMVALLLGLLLSAGVVTLFSNTSKSNRVQDAMARLQENGRYAISRMNSDLRMVSAQYCSNFSGASTATANGPIVSLRAPEVFVASLNLPDAAAPTPAASPYPLSPRTFVQGYECSSGTCSPAVPAGIPAVGTSDGSRLKGTDVLTIRYQRGTGWPLTTAVTCGGGTTVTLSPQAGDDSTTSPPAFKAGDYAMVSDCQDPSIVPISGYAGGVLTVAPSILTGTLGPACNAPANRDTRVFNFSTGFVTVTYYIRLGKDLSPDAGGRLIPSLVRRVNATAPDQELVQGVERLDFLYGVQDKDGAVRYLSASDVDNAPTSICPDPPEGVALEAGCLWRSVKSIEVHTLLDSVENMYDLAVADTAFRYSVDGNAVAAPAGANSAVTDLPFGKMIRREFMTTVTARNYNP